MSDRQDEGRQERLDELKRIIRDLHAGADPADLRGRFADLIRGVGGAEVSRLEQQLIEEGMPASEIKRLCDVHVQVFRESLDEQAKPEMLPGHPVHTFRAENEKLKEAAERLQTVLADLGDPSDAPVLEKTRQELQELLERLSAVKVHYLRKENQLFPLLEHRGISGPTQVMWAIHDDVRALLKRFAAAIDSGDAAEAAASGTELTRAALDMVYKEENVLFPTAVDVLTEGDWVAVRRGEEELGYALVEPGNQWKPSAAPTRVSRAAGYRDAEGGALGSGAVGGASESEADGAPRQLPLDTGALTPEQVNLLLKGLPIDVTFVDENDEVRYYSATDERIFPRSPGVIGRRVQNCHPPDSVAVVEKILDAFKNGDRDTAEFWLRMGEKLVYIRYFAVRDRDGRYGGTIEVTQDVAPIQRLSGERRLLDWD